MYPSQIGDSDKVQFSYTFSPVHSKTFRTVSCGDCTHVFCSPIPENIGKYYVDVVDDEYLRHEDSRKLAGREVIRALGASTAPVPSDCWTLAAPLATSWIARKKEAMSPRALSLQWSAKIARNRGFQVYGEFLDTFVASHKGQYDVVTLWGVIEHFARPLDELQRIRQLLKPNGILALWTGDVSSITSRALGRKWWYWQGQHIQYFTEDSLSRLARTTGFEPVRIDRYPFAATRETLSNSLRRYPVLRPLLMAALTPLFWLRPIVYLRLPGEMFFVARTPGGWTPRPRTPGGR